MPVLKPKDLITNRVVAIRDFHAAAGTDRAELDLSGGIDSAVMAGLLVMALGADKVTLAHLAINSNPVQTERAARLAAGIRCNLAVGDFTVDYHTIVAKIIDSIVAAEPTVSVHVRGPGSPRPDQLKRAEIEARIEADPTILGSIRSTLRAPLGRAYNRLTGGGIRHGTGNECEDRIVRFFQKGGDGEVDTNPIAMLSKAEVYQLAFELANSFGPAAKAAYLDTIRALPSADLWGSGDKHNDEGELASWLGAAFTYGRLDADTGKVVNIGTIERVARFLDERIPHTDGEAPSPLWQETCLFMSDLSQDDMKHLVSRAVGSKAFSGSGLTPDDILALLRGARKAERQTRHKLNPNCPQLGTRAELVSAGILSDDFADYGI